MSDSIRSASVALEPQSIQGDLSADAGADDDADNKQQHAKRHCHVNPASQSAMVRQHVFFLVPRLHAFSHWY
jgi:hypothetical protein